MSLAAVLLPVFVQVGLTFFLGFWAARERTAAFRAGLVGKEAALYPVRWPETAQKVANSFQNQFEVPHVFYVLVAFALITHKTDLPFVVLSWIFVAFRIVHAYVHTTNNIVKWRGAAYGLGVLVLLIMWVIFAVRILFL